MRLGIWPFHPPATCFLQGANSSPLGEDKPRPFPHRRGFLFNSTIVAISKKTKIKIKELASVNNPGSIHGIYPYRGKISAIDAEMVVSQLNKSKTLLDPFCGSGTIVYEAAKHGLNAIGFDTNPLAIWLSEGKSNLANLDEQKIIDEADQIIKLSKRKKLKKSTELSKKTFHDDTANEIFSVAQYFRQMSPYVKAAFLGSIALTARGCNHYKWTSSTVGKDIQPKRYIDFFEKFKFKVKKHLYPIKRSKTQKISIFQNDSRELSNILKPKSIDYVFTSPPYFDGLDYTAYYGKIVYDILEVSRAEIKKNLIQTVKSYEQDMAKVLEEIVKVTKNDAMIIFVVGDKKVKDKVINGGDFFSKLLHHKPNEIIERRYTGSSSQIFDTLNKTDRKEQIIIWDKSTWKE